MYSNLALIDPATTWNWLTGSGFDPQYLDDGASLTWYVHFQVYPSCSLASWGVTCHISGAESSIASQELSPYLGEMASFCSLNMPHFSTSCLKRGTLTPKSALGTWRLLQAWEVLVETVGAFLLYILLNHDHVFFIARVSFFPCIQPLPAHISPIRI